MVEGYIFDMDGVLCDSESFIAEAAMVMFKTRYQVEVTRADFEPFIGMGEDRYLGAWRKNIALIWILKRIRQRLIGCMDRVK